MQSIWSLFKKYNIAFISYDIVESDAKLSISDCGQFLCHVGGDAGGHQPGDSEGKEEGTIDKEYVMQFREGEKVKCEMVGGETNKQGENKLVEDV
jgi:hypothetical protein